MQGQFQGERFSTGGQNDAAYALLHSIYCFMYWNKILFVYLCLLLFKVESRETPFSIFQCSELAIKLHPTLNE